MASSPRRSGAARHGRCSDATATYPRERPPPLVATCRHYSRLGGKRWSMRRPRVPIGGPCAERMRRPAGRSSSNRSLVIFCRRANAVPGAAEDTEAGESARLASRYSRLDSSRLDSAATAATAASIRVCRAPSLSSPSPSHPSKMRRVVASASRPSRRKRSNGIERRASRTLRLARRMAIVGKGATAESSTRTRYRKITFTRPASRRMSRATLSYKLASVPRAACGVIR